MENGGSNENLINCNIIRRYDNWLKYQIEARDYCPRSLWEMRKGSLNSAK